MAKIEAGRFAAHMPEDFVVFVIGMRVNALWAVHKWKPVSDAMPRMLEELFAQPELGLLHAEYFLSWRNVMVLQYWRSYEQLHAYAHAADKTHLPAWAAFNKAARGNAAVGIYHETYLSGPGRYETVYANMPRFGLAKAGELVPAIGSMHNASSRLGRPSASTEPPDPSKT
jgi:hypothetical protein